MNLIVVDETDLTPSGRIAVGGRRATHISRIIGPAIGERLRVGWIRGGVATAAVALVGDDRVELEDFDLTALRRPARPPRTSVVLAVPRPKAIRRTVETCACFGVARLDLTNAWRVEKSYLASPRLEPALLESAARLGLEQGGGTWMPDIEVHRLFVPFVRGLAERAGARVFFDPGATDHLEDVDVRDPVTVALGPEGGWIDSERASLLAAGFRAVSLGAAILRTEIAAAAALAQLELIRRRRGSASD